MCVSIYLIFYRLTLEMYKYIIYCSISACIIILSKYLYQNWIKQNHSISTLKQEVSLLNDKIKRLESELEKNKNSISGGIKIPIQFAQIQKNTPIDFQQNTLNTVTLEHDIESNSSDSVSSSSSNDVAVNDVKSKESSKASKESSKELKESKESSKKSSIHKKVLEVENLSEINDIELDNITLSGLDQLDQQAIQEIVIEPKVETVKKTIKKKAGIPDAKDFNNGDKVSDDNGIEYLCVVGKRGGHSWKQLN